MTTDDIMQPYHDYLEQRRRALLTELDEIEKQLGTSPRTSQLRKAFKDGGFTRIIYDGIAKKIEEG